MKWIMLKKKKINRAFSCTRGNVMDALRCVRRAPSKSISNDYVCKRTCRLGTAQRDVAIAGGRLVCGHFHKHMKEPMAMASILPLLQLAADLAVAGISLMFVLGVFAFVAIVLCSVAFIRGSRLLSSWFGRVGRRGNLSDKLLRACVLWLSGR